MAGMTVSFAHGMGDRVKSRVTGFEGIVIGVDCWMTGCKRYGVQPRGLTEEGKQKATAWIDEEYCELVEAGVVVLQEEPSGGPHGDKPVPGAK